MLYQENSLCLSIGISNESLVTDGFVITSVDDTDKGTPSAALSFANDKYELQGSYVEALKPKPQSIKNSHEQHVMFHRQSAVGNGDEILFREKIYLDGGCLCRSVAGRLEHSLLTCPRGNSGAPTNSSLFNLEKTLADTLRETPTKMKCDHSVITIQCCDH